MESLLDTGGNVRSAKSKRHQLEIIASVLEIAEKGATKTGLVYKANLNFTMIQKYIRLLESKGMLECVHTSGTRTYRATEKGAAALESIRAATKPFLE
jgi:predicted transcriptional regulator